MYRLNSKVLLLMVAGLLSTIVVVGFSGFIFLRSALQESVSSNQLRMAATTMGEVNRILHARLLGIQVVASDRELADSLTDDESLFSDNSEAEVLARLRALRTPTGPWEVLWILDTDGQIRLSSRSGEAGSTLDSPAVTAIFEAALAGAITHSDFITVEATGRGTVLFAAPIRLHGRPDQPILGVAMGHFSWPTLLQILEAHELHAVLLNNKGKVIAANTRYTIEDLTGRSYRESSLLPPLLAGTSFSRVVEGQEGFTQRSMLASLAAQLDFLGYQGNGWGLVLQTPTDVAFAPATRKAVQLVGIIAALFAVIIGALMFFLRRLVVRPVVSLTHTAKAIAGGNLQKRTEVKSNDEIGQLGIAFNDMTDKLQKSYAKLEQQIKELKELDRLKDNFLNNTTHELKTPLIPIKSQVQLLLAEDYGSLNKEQKESIEMIARNEDQLESLVSDVVDITKIRSGKLQLIKEQADLTEIITMAVQDWQMLAREQGIKLRLQFGAAFPAMSLDGKRITQVLSNLLGNALKFTQPKAAHLGGQAAQVTVMATREADKVIVSVTDNGIGMSKDTLKKLFTPFFQAQSDEARKYEGTGLGLAISKGFVEAHGGAITATSPGEGKGSTVSFWLPIEGDKA